MIKKFYLQNLIPLLAFLPVGVSMCAWVHNLKLKSQLSVVTLRDLETSVLKCIKLFSFHHNEMFLHLRK